MMKYPFIAVICAFLLIDPLLALEWTHKGHIQHYGVSLGAYSTQPALTYQFNQFRSDTRVDISDAASVHTRINLDNYWASASLAATYIQATKHMSNELPLTLTKTLLASDTHVTTVSVFRAYGTYQFEHGYGEYGLKRFPLGVGVLWRPIDTINSYNPLNPIATERLGVIGGSYTHELSPDAYWQVIATHGKDGGLNHRGARIQWNQRGTDIGLTALAANTEDLLGVDLSGDLLNTGMGIYSELAIKRSRVDDKIFIQHILGLTYILNESVSITVEGYVNGAGAASLAEYVFNPNVQNWEQLGRHYLGAVTTIQVSPLVSLSGTGLINLTDGSAIIGPQLTWSFKENWEMSLGGTVTTGQAGSEFNFYPNQLFVSVATYF